MFGFKFAFNKLIDGLNADILAVGLDEVETHRQNICIQAINQFIESEFKPKHLVASSSFEVYKNTRRLKRPGKAQFWWAVSSRRWPR